jgi:hypothetical protein
MQGPASLEFRRSSVVIGPSDGRWIVRGRSFAADLEGAPLASRGGVEAGGTAGAADGDARGAASFAEEATGGVVAGEADPVPGSGVAVGDEPASEGEGAGVGDAAAPS